MCGGTGSWAKPYKDAGYDVRTITLPEHDIRDQNLQNELIALKPYGILAAPPCTHFSGSGAHTWKAKDRDGRTLEDLSIATACLMIIAKANPVFWALENPVGRMRRWFGAPVMYFNPCDYGDPYTKKTCLWGNFNPPKQRKVEPVFVTRGGKRYSPIFASTGGKSARTKELRSIPPAGFAKAFYEANR